MQYILTQQELDTLKEEAIIEYNKKSLELYDKILKVITEHANDPYVRSPIFKEILKEIGLS